MKIKRRHFLTFTSLAALFPLRNFLQNRISRDEQKVEFKDKKYILLNVVESPSRWMFDTILKPKSEHLFYENQFIATNFKSLGSDPLQFEYEYKFHQHNDFLFPLMWKYNIPTPSGEDKLTNLAENMLIVRGCNMVFDGHEINSKRLEAPSLGHHSIAGLHDHTTPGLFPCIALEGEKESGTAAQAYSSPTKSKIPIKKTSSHYVNDLLESFLSKSSDEVSDDLLEEILTVKFRRDNISSFIKQHREKKRAKKYILEKYSNIKSDYEKAITKYQDLIDRCLKKTNLEGITDKKIPGLKLPISLEKKLHPDGTPFQIVDYIGAYKQEDNIILADDLRTMFDTAEIKELSKQMALTEVAITYNLTNSIILNISPLKELRTEVIPLEDLVLKNKGSKVVISIKNNSSPKILNINHEADSHQTGSLSTFLCDTLMWRAVASTTQELINVIKKTDSKLWKNTLIHLTTEFEREPGDIDKGSHHGFTGHTSTFFSGSIDRTNVIGNIYNISHDPTDVSPGCGTWGKGAPIAALGDRTMVYGNIASSIADFLGCPSPMPHEPRVFKYTNNKISPLIEDALNKDFHQKPLKFDKPAAT